MRLLVCVIFACRTPVALARQSWGHHMSYEMSHSMSHDSQGRQMLSHSWIYVTIF
jgi:hypothetical protein